MFIEKLSDEQMCAFLKKMYPKYHFSFYRYKENIEVSVTNCNSLPDDYTWNERYTDFESTRNESKWIKYLAEIFGQEYKDAYLKDCSKIFDWHWGETICLLFFFTLSFYHL